MKKRFLKYSLVLFVLGISSCNKFGDVNTDTTRSVNLDPSIVLSNVQLRFSGDLEVNEKVGMGITMPAVQQIGGIWANRNGQFYIRAIAQMFSLWDYSYKNEIINIVDAVNRTDKDPAKTNINAVCRIMKVYQFARITDMYGDIPYFQAGRGYIDGITRPVFDKQEDIYNDFFKELKEASEQLDPNKDVVRGDLFFNGNIAAWKKFANSLRLRYAMRLVKVNPSKAEAEATAAYQAGVFTSNADIAMTRHQDIVNNYDDFRGNSISASFVINVEVLPRVQNTFIEHLENTNDPRLSRLIRYYHIDLPQRPLERLDITDQVRSQIGYQGVERDEYVWTETKPSFVIQVPGVGDVIVGNYGQKAQLANFLIRLNAPFFHQTYAEVELLLAEATVRWGQKFGKSAEDHYKDGVKAAMNQLSFYPEGPVIPDAEINTFTSNNSLIPGRELEVINEQLWVTLLLNGPEAYANWRRSGFPVLIPAVTDESSIQTIPRRLEYPTLELEQNAENAAAAIERLGPGGNVWSNRVWWDKQ